jgi:hypothetical protein
MNFTVKDINNFCLQNLNKPSKINQVNYYNLIESQKTKIKRWGKGTIDNIKFKHNRFVIKNKK